MSEPELQPDVSDVLQEEAPDQLTAIPVCVVEHKAPVRVQLLPDKTGSTQTRTVSTTPKSYLRADHRRGRAVLMSMDQNIRIAFSEAAAQDDSSMSLWPKLVPFEVPAAVEVWVKSTTETTSVSFTTFGWAAGQ